MADEDDNQSNDWDSKPEGEGMSYDDMLLQVCATVIAITNMTLFGLKDAQRAIERNLSSGEERAQELHSAVLASGMMVQALQQVTAELIAQNPKAKAIAVMNMDDGESVEEEVEDDGKPSVPVLKIKL